MNRSALLLVLLACAPRVPAPAAEPLRDLVISEEDCEGAAEFSASRADVLADLDVVERVLRDGWAGFEQRQAEGTDWKATFASLRASVAELPDPVPADLLRKHLARNLAPAARDNHLSFGWVDALGRTHQSSAAGRHLDAWTTDGGAGEGAFLARSPLRVEQRPLQLAPARPGSDWRRLVGGPPVRRAAVFSRDGGVLALDSLDTGYGEQLQAFVDSAASVRDLPWAVLDLRGNGGGGDGAAIDFVRGLTEGALQYAGVDVLDSDVTRQGWLNAFTCDAARPDIDRESRLELVRNREAVAASLVTAKLRTWSGGRGEPYQGAAPAPYRGALVLLVDRRCASSCESLVTFARQVPGVVVLGENTTGAGVFGEALVYRLPRTGLWMRAGCKRFSWTEESRGVLPDLWLDDPDPLGAAVELAQCLAKPGCPVSLPQR